MMATAALLWLQAAPDVRSVSWWLPTGAARDAVWWIALTLNLAVLVYLLYRLLFKGADINLPRMLRSRGQDIQTQLREAEQTHAAAQQRLAEIEARLANLPAELLALEKEAGAEAEKEYQRLLEVSRRDAAAIVDAGRREIDAAAKLAQKELKSLAAGLAVDLARQRIQERLTPEADQAVVRSAVENMGLGRPN